MVRKGHDPEQIVDKLHKAEVLLGQGATVASVSRQIGVSEQTYYRWRKQYGGMRIDQARHLKELELENYRLKRLLYEITPDISQRKKR